MGLFLLDFKAERLKVGIVGEERGVVGICK